MQHAELMIVGVGEVLMAAALPQDKAEGTGRSSASLLHTDWVAACQTRSALLQGSFAIASWPQLSSYIFSYPQQPFELPVCWIGP